MDGDVETHQLDEGGLVTEAEKVGQVPGVVLGGVDGGKLATAVGVAVNAARYIWQLGNATNASYNMAAVRG